MGGRREEELRPKEKPIEKGEKEESAGGTAGPKGAWI